MTRIFDIENEKDMADLWDILPDYIDTIRGMTRYDSYLFSKGRCEMTIPANLIAINWHDKTEITRPMQEATEDDVGKICCFWNEDTDYCVFGFLTKITPHITEVNKSKYQYMNKNYYNHCRRLTKQEIEELI